MEYKGMLLDDDIGAFVRYMPQVDTYRESLSHLQAVWDNLALLGQLSGVGSEMGNTRESFFALSQSLVNHLAREHYQRVEDGLKMKASVVVDMMQRNLFERTADIGFLATDDAIREFMRVAPQWQSRYSAATRVLRETYVQKMQQRMQAYLAKYSVYNNVILLSPDGEVVFQLVETGVKQSNDTFIQAARSTTEAYIEIFRQTDLLPTVAQPHIYAYRITDESDTLLGVLCLCFDFQDECQRIFAELEDTDWTVMALTDEQGIVIASHDSVQVPVGSVMSGTHKCAVSVQRFAGRQYLSFTCQGKGYQGYLGQGWMGHAMVPLEYAFEQMKALTLELPSIDRLTVFSQDLIMIPQQADQIQERLNRSVWNGSVRQARNPTDSGFGRALLNEVSQTGLKTKAVFAGAIANLYQTVIGATLENNRVLASLAVNIMDRNLYERANDCRWWALTDVFRQLLSKEDLTIEDKKQMSQILIYINQLYTVYTGLIVYDKNGCVQAVSQKHLLPFIGKKLQASWIDASLILTDSQAYVVSDFESTPLYDNKATYIYAAAIMHPDNEAQAVGGIGIVFDATPQFTTILEDASPEGHGQESFAICYDEHQRIISSTHPTLQVGDILPADMTLAQNQGSAVLSCGYGRYAVGVAQSTGYREYKGEGDAYQQVVYAAMFKRIGMLSTEDYMTKEASITSFNFSAAGPKKAIATFAIGEQCFGLSASDVIESIDVDLMARVAVANSIFSGYVKYDNYPVPVLDLSSYLEESLTAQQQVVIIESNEVRFALLVSKIGSVVSVPTAMIMPVSSYSQTNLIESLVTEQGKSLPILMLLSSNKIRELVISGRVVMEAMPDISELIEASSNKEEHTL